MKRPSPSKWTLGYAGIIGVSLVIAIVAGWTGLAPQIDDSAYDWMFRRFPPPPIEPHCIILAIDDATLGAMGSQREYRTILATGLELLAAAHPKVVAIDMVLEDQAGASEDDPLERAMQATKNLVLVAHLAGPRWEHPLPRFAQMGGRSWDTIKPTNSRTMASLGRFRSSNARREKGTGLWRWKRFAWRAENGSSKLPKKSKSET